MNLLERLAELGRRIKAGRKAADKGDRAMTSGHLLEKENVFFHRLAENAECTVEIARWRIPREGGPSRPIVQGAVCRLGKHRRQASREVVIQEISVELSNCVFTSWNVAVDRLAMLCYEELP